jgi:hypothetical protein
MKGRKQPAQSQANADNICLVLSNYLGGEVPLQEEEGARPLEIKTATRNPFLQQSLDRGLNLQPETGRLGTLQAGDALGCR